MSHGTADRVALNVAAQTVLRVLIASYFLAVALRLMPGTALSSLFAGILPAPYAAATTAGLVFIFSFMIMLDMATRLAALFLALMTFFASYLAMLQLGVADELGAFWRDLALIAALLLTYAEPQLGQRRHRRVVHRQIVPRRISAAAPRRVNAVVKRATGLADEVPALRPQRAQMKARLEGTARVHSDAAPDGAGDRARASDRDHDSAAPDRASDVTSRPTAPSGGGAPWREEPVIWNIFADDTQAT